MYMKKAFRTALIVVSGLSIPQSLFACGYDDQFYFRASIHYIDRAIVFGLLVFLFLVLIKKRKKLGVIAMLTVYGIYLCALGFLYFIYDPGAVVCSPGQGLSPAWWMFPEGSLYN